MLLYFGLLESTIHLIGSSGRAWYRIISRFYMTTTLSKESIQRRIFCLIDFPSDLSIIQDK